MHFHLVISVEVQGSSAIMHKNHFRYEDAATRTHTHTHVRAHTHTHALSFKIRNMTDASLLYKIVQHRERPLQKLYNSLLSEQCFFSTNIQFCCCTSNILLINNAINTTLVPATFKMRLLTVKHFQ